MTCRRGEVYWVDWPEGRGSEQRGRRPALVVQNNRGNRSSPTTVLAAISSAPDPLAAAREFITRIENAANTAE